MDSDQKTLNMAVIGTDTLARGAIFDDFADGDGIGAYRNLINVNFGDNPDRAQELSDKERSMRQGVGVKSGFENTEAFVRRWTRICRWYARFSAFTDEGERETIETDNNLRNLLLYRCAKRFSDLSLKIQDEEEDRKIAGMNP